MKVRVLARHDRGEQPAGEREPPDPLHPQRVARDLHDHRVGAGVREAAQRRVQLDRRRRREPEPGVRERAIARAQRPEHSGPAPRRVEQLAQNVRRARLAERAGEPDQAQPAGGMAMEPRRQIRERLARGCDADDRHAGLDLALRDDRHRSPRHRLVHEGVPVQRRARHRDEHHPRRDPAAVLSETGDVGVWSGCRRS